MVLASCLALLSVSFLPSARATPNVINYAHGWGKIASSLSAVGQPVNLTMSNYTGGQVLLGATVCPVGVTGPTELTPSGGSFTLLNTTTNTTLPCRTSIWVGAASTLVRLAWTGGGTIIVVRLMAIEFTNVSTFGAHAIRYGTDAGSATLAQSITTQQNQSWVAAYSYISGGCSIAGSHPVLIGNPGGVGMVRLRNGTDPNYGVCSAMGDSHGPLSDGTSYTVQSQGNTLGDKIVLGVVELTPTVPPEPIIVNGVNVENVFWILLFLSFLAVGVVGAWKLRQRL